MSKNDLGNLSKDERAALSARVRPLRQAANLKQDELAELADVSRQTISNMENGSITPQADVLGRVLRVLGVDLETSRFEPQTDLWLSMIGTLIEAIPERDRPPAVDGAIRVLAEGVRAAKPDNVRQLRPDVRGAIDDAQQDEDEYEEPRAAGSDRTQVDPGDVEP